MSEPVSGINERKENKDDEIKGRKERKSYQVGGLRWDAGGVDLKQRKGT